MDVLELTATVLYSTRDQIEENPSFGLCEESGSLNDSLREIQVFHIIAPSLFYLQILSTSL